MVPHKHMASKALPDCLAHEEVQAAEAQLRAANTGVTAALELEEHLWARMDKAAGAEISVADAEVLARQHKTYVDLAGEFVTAKKTVDERALALLTAGLALMPPCAATPTAVSTSRR
jgi:hypothetical protein